MTRDELLARLAGLRQARVGQVRVPHKPLLLLWLFGQFAATGSSVASYQQAGEPVSQLINDFGPPVASPAAARQRAAMPFVHLERQLWDLRDATGKEIGPDAPERRAWLLERGAVGRLRAPVERLLADPGTLAAAARLLLDRHFTPVLAELICAAVDLDVAALDLAGSGGAAYGPRSRQRRRGFAEEVLRAYAYQCAMCGFDGALGRHPVGIEAAHVRWHSQHGPDETANALALCALHYALFDLGVVGITQDRRIRVSSLYVARNEAGRAVDALAGQPLLIPRPRQQVVDVVYISWHHQQVFKGHHAEGDATIISAMPVKKAACVLLESLVGQPISTVTGRPNAVLRVEGDNVVVATNRPPAGQPVPIEWVQSGLDQLLETGEIEVSVPSLGHRSSFVGAVLLTLPGAVLIRLNQPTTALKASMTQVRPQ